MYKQQTIVMDIDRGKAFEDKKIDKNGKEETFFIETDFDVKIEEFIESLLASKCQPLSTATFATNEHLIAFITYSDNPVKDLQQSSLLATPNKLRV